MRAGPTSGHRCSPSSPRRICISRSMPSRRMRMASSVASSSGVGPACCCGPAAAVRVRIAANSVVISLSVRSRRASRACQCRSRSASKARRVVGAGAAARSGLTASQAGRGGSHRVAAAWPALCGSAHNGPGARSTVPALHQPQVQPRRGMDRPPDVRSDTAQGAGSLRCWTARLPHQPGCLVCALRRHITTPLGSTDPDSSPLPAQQRESCPANRRPDRLALAPGCGVAPLLQESEGTFRSQVDRVDR